MWDDLKLRTRLRMLEEPTRSARRESDAASGLEMSPGDLVLPAGARDTAVAGPRPGPRPARDVLPALPPLAVPAPTGK